MKSNLYTTLTIKENHIRDILKIDDKKRIREELIRIYEFLQGIEYTYTMFDEVIPAKLNQLIILLEHLAKLYRD